MGFSISWAAFKGAGRAEVLKRLGLRDLQSDDEFHETPLSLAELPTGWTILHANDFKFGAAEHLIELSSEGAVVACQVEEHIMFSAAHCYTKGREDWSVWHDAERGIYDLSIRGKSPPQLAPIQARLTALQDRNGGKDGFVDFIFDVPVELAAELTGYRHDRMKFAWGMPHFTAVERVH